ncbi:MAG: hypothetical protein V5A21_05930 [Halapricum sp.]
MPMKGSGSAELREIDRYDGGVGWIAYPDEEMQRASHAVVGEEGGVWVLDPVDAEGLDELLAEYGEVAGVVVLLDRHKRDADAIARRHESPVYVPDWMSGVESKLDAPVERVHTDLEESGFGVHRLIDNALWQEAVLYGEHDGTLVVPESLGTAEYFLTGGERLGVHPALRLKPPRKLRRFAPERVLVGHGEGVPTDAARAIDDALDGARRRAPRLYAETVRSMIFG